MLFPHIPRTDGVYIGKTDKEKSRETAGKIKAY
jgi:hypothetical protein